MTVLSQQIRFTRILHLFLYLNQNGATAPELAALGNCTERTVHRDIVIIKRSGVIVTCIAGLYHIPNMPKMQKLDFDATKVEKKESTTPAIFRKWYEVASKGVGRGHEYWYVVRADKRESKGTCVGPIQITGKSWHTVAVEQAKQRNDEILRKREAVEGKLREMGWTNERIRLIKDKALSDSRKEMGDDYKEQDP